MSQQSINTLKYPIDMGSYLLAKLEIYVAIREYKAKGNIDSSLLTYYKQNLN